ncbi:MAG: tetratricopeptide repeat protein [Chitinispirillaceae bacterium]|nr:tetratricopeptide repeat protein [Chitinispirillaceae bacterium]
MGINRLIPLKGNACRSIICCGIVAAVTFIAFYPCMRNDFTNWDDGQYVVVNPDIQGFTFQKLTKIFSSAYVNNYQPLAMLTYMAEYRFFKLDPAVYHTTNMVLHIMNGVLVFLLVHGLSGSRASGLLAALLFAVHPLRVESVAWIAERKDVLSAFFFLLSLLSYLRYLNGNKRNYYRLCALALLFSLLSKPMAVSQPFVLLLIVYLRSGKVSRKAVLDTIPFFVLSAIFIGITLYTQLTASEPDALRILPFQRIFAPFYGIVFYLFKSLVPVHLCAFYPFPEKPDPCMDLKLLMSCFVVMGLAAAIWRYRARSRTLVFGSLFFLVTAMPVLQIVPVGSAIVAERYTYIPLLGISFIAAELFSYLLAIRFAGEKTVQVVLASGIGAAVAVFCFLTYGRCGVWKDSLSLWNDVIGRHPVAFAYNNRGKFHSARGDYEKALADFGSAIVLRPAFALPYYNRAIIYRTLGDYDSALADNTSSIRYNPAFTEAYNNRGIIYNLKGDYDRGIIDFTRAITLDPGYAEAYFNRGFAFEGINEYGRALDDYRRACALGDAIACQRLGKN